MFLPSTSSLLHLCLDSYGNGEIFTKEDGTWVNKHGKGEYEFYKSGERGVGQWTNGTPEGEHQFYDREGNMTIEHYKNGMKVDK